MDFRFLQTLNLNRFIVLSTTFVLGIIGNYSHGQNRWSDQMNVINPKISDPFEIDERLLQAAGIRKISGQHLTLYTDVPKSPSIEELPVAFDQAIEPWCNAFEVKNRFTKNWRLRGYLISDPSQLDKFRKAGLAPRDLPEFQAGYQRGHDLWLFLQPGNYYTRHLLIHEGTHGFMQWFKGGYGPAWYAEGMAELYGVHRWQDNKIELGYRLRDKSEADYWGRVKRIKDERGTVNAMTLTDVLAIPPAAFKDVRYYAWAWAGCKFLSNHPASKKEFAKLIGFTSLSYQKFNSRFVQSLKNDWATLERDWLLYVNEIEYGYEVERGAMTDAHMASPGSYFLRVDRGWQKTEVTLKKGDKVKISARGRFRVGQSTVNGKITPWPCEANGVTLEYYQGKPLGILLAGILNADEPNTENQVRGLLEPVSVGNGLEFAATESGILCFRINESPSKLDDNDGTLEVLLEKLR